ncbi:MAG: Rrf2 family transcriptional regulator [bacterium]
MRISSLEEYGLRCMMALARTGLNGQLSIPEIAKCEGLSVPYASKLLSILRKAKLVNAVRGRGGGFCISRPAIEITFLDVILALGGPMIDPDHCNRFSGNEEECVHIDDCSVHNFFNSLAGFMEDMLSKTTLQDILDREQAILAKKVITPDSLFKSEIKQHDSNPN